MAIQSQQEYEPEEEEKEETPNEKRSQERLETSREIVKTQQTDCMHDFQTEEGIQLFSLIVKKTGSTSPVLLISKQPIVTELAQDQPRAASVSVPITDFIISNEALWKKCQKPIDEAARERKWILNHNVSRRNKFS